MSAVVQKMVWTVLAVGIYALTAWPPMAGVAEALKVLAGLVVGGVWLPRPGDGAEMARLRKSVPPALEALFLIAFPTLGVLAASQIVACAGTPEQATQNRIAANALRDQVNEASDALTLAHGALPIVCAHLGPDSSACTTLEDTYRVLASAVDTAHRGIDLLDAVGIGGEELRESAERVLSESKAFGASVARLGSEVADVLDENRRRGSDAAGSPAQQPAEASEAAPAQGAGQAPAEAAAP